ncbi:MAG: hypothetical protein VZS44_10150 [Bacilli bacterium]|nr:hypothetical protein [Bacilli bacterium]
MKIKDIFNVLDTSEVQRICVFPKTQPVLGIRPNEGRFVSISITDRDKIMQILDMEVEQISISDGFLNINV